MPQKIRPRKRCTQNSAPTRTCQMSDVTRITFRYDATRPHDAMMSMGNGVASVMIGPDGKDDKLIIGSDTATRQAIVRLLECVTGRRFTLACDEAWLTAYAADRGRAPVRA